MVRETLVKGAAEYFHSRQWEYFMDKILLRSKGGEVYHAHIYTDTCLHPNSIKALIELYFTAINRPLTRATDPTANRPGVAAVHGIHPIGCAHFEVIFRFNKDVVWCEMPVDAPEAEHGQNLLYWDNECINSITAKIPFRYVGPREEANIREFFLTSHWKRCLAGIMNPNYGHFHINVEINFDPKILELLMREEFARMGWTVDKVVPCVFDMASLTRLDIDDPNDPRKSYVGKINFNLGHPERMFDVAWMFNPSVTIQPSRVGWIFGTPGYDAWPAKNYDDFIASSEYVELCEEELKAVAKTFLTDNPYVRKE